MLVYQTCWKYEKGIVNPTLKIKNKINKNDKD